jgi:hypothetical protein
MCSPTNASRKRALLGIGKQRGPTVSVPRWLDLAASIVAVGPVAPNAYGSAWLYPSTLRLPGLPYTLSNTEVVLSDVLEEEFTFSVLRRSLTNCTDWDATLVSLVNDGELVFLRSFCTVAKAD